MIRKVLFFVLVALCVAVDPFPRLKAYRFHAESPIEEPDRISVQQTTISKADLAHDLRIPLRDLRLIDTGAKLSAIVARRRAIILSLGNTKAIIQERGAIVVAATDEDLESLCARVKSHLSMQPGGGGTFPFDQRVLEACVQHAVCDIRNSLFALKADILGTLGRLRAAQDQGALAMYLEVLLPLKTELNNLRASAQELLRAINEALSNDEDLDAMQLSQLSQMEEAGTVYDALAGLRLYRLKKLLGGGTAPLSTSDVDPYSPIYEKSHASSTADHDSEEALEPRIDHSGTEMLLEAYLTQLESLTTEAGDVASTIKSTEEIVDLQLDLVRNKILSVELRLSVASFMVGLGCFVTGMFGMNLLSHIETQPHAFWTTSALLLLGMGGGYLGFVEACRRLGLVR